MLDGIDHGIQFGLVDEIVADDKGDGAGRHRIHDGAETALLAVHD